MKIGNTDITNPKIGATEINKVFLGLNKVWERLSFLLDSLTGSTGAFSLRLLSSSYTGDAIQVRRVSDNTTQNIGFVSNQLDTASLNTFCSGTDGFVSIWYNQSDVSNNLIQTTLVNQPKIYDSITGVEVKNGLPTVVFNGSSYLNATNNTYGDIDDVLTTIAVVTTESNSVQMIASKGWVGNGEHLIWFNTGVTYRYAIEGQVISTTANIPLSQQNLFSLFLSTGTNGVNQFNNGVLGKQTTTTKDLTGSSSGSVYALGYNLDKGLYHLTGNVQELLTFNSDLISDRSTIEDNINTNYTIY